MDAEYVLDRMPFYEIRDALEGLYLRHKETWAQTRLQAYLFAQANSRKKLPAVNEWMPFSWEKKEEDFDDTFNRINAQLKAKSAHAQFIEAMKEKKTKTKMQTNG